MDPYVYPDSNVLRNLAGLRDREELGRFEMDMSSMRLMELAFVPVAGKLDAAHLRAIHHYIFQDVYDWAGKFRTVNIARSGEYYFAFWDRMEGALGDALGKLARERFLAGLEREAFCGRAAFYLGEINAIHPFRDGNGRTQREFLRVMAVRNGFALDWSRVTRDQMSAASQLSFRKGDNTGLAALLLEAVSPLSSPHVS